MIKTFYTACVSISLTFTLLVIIEIFFACLVSKIIIRSSHSKNENVKIQMINYFKKLPFIMILIVILFLLLEEESIKGEKIYRTMMILKSLSIQIMITIWFWIVK